MGLIDRIKETARGAEATVGGQIVGALGEHRERAMRLNEAGVNHPATVLEMTETGRSDPGGGREIEFKVEVDPGGGSYRARFAQFVLYSETGSIGPGSRITVRVDPDDRSILMFWGAG